MTPAWRDFLDSRGARFDGAQVTDFGDLVGELTAAANGLVLADLSDWGLIGLSGDEAQTFLHSQITNDLRDLNETSAVFAGYCSAKGRLLANFIVLRCGDDILLLLPAELREAVQKRLSMFILRSKVKARDASAEWVRLGLAGPGAAGLLTETLGLEAPTTPMAVAQDERAIVLALGPDRYDVLVAPEAAATLWQVLANNARPVGAAAWNGLLVRAGIPVIVTATQDQFVPQMANMEVLHGVSFNKGCYPGQEIVARTQYLGKLKRRMFLARVEATATPGQEVFSPVLGAQGAGMIANAAPAAGGGTDILVVLRLDAYENGAVHLGAPDGPALAFRPLPYSL